ncbi:efflux RND transporter periplasmic adaptor subunit [Sneathiella sp.]|uniref:efflux RND transporter periplasmic adaptor subunit n=1 Tax=Sneathiella sp. TaxID=1964365 RepID=UPI0039E3221E
MNRSVIIAGVIAVGVTGWIVSGQFKEEPTVETVAADPSSEIASALQPKETGPVNVQTKIFVAEPRAQEVVVRGRTEAIRTVELKAETPGRVVEVLVERGQRVKEGDVLVKFAVKDRLAQLAEAEALIRQREIEYKAANALNKKGFSAATTLAGSKALLDSARAKAKSVKILLEDLIIRAPFDGIIDERAAEIGDFIKDGGTILTIVDENPFLVTGQISELYVNRIKVGDEGTAKLVTGEVVKGKVRFISKTSDPATRTFRVELLVQNDDKRLRSGVTAETTFKTEEVMAHFISPAFLTLNEAGELGVRAVNEENTVIFYPVTVLTDGTAGAWIGGLPKETRLITVGQEYVREGEKVAYQTKTAGAQ